MVQIQSRSASIDKDVSETGDLIDKVCKPASCGHGAAIVPLLDENVKDAEESISSTDSSTESLVDPWDLPELQDNSPSFSSLSLAGKVRRVLWGWLGRLICLLALLYFFICSLDFLSSAFRLLGGKAAGEVFSSSVVVQNPVAGLMMGVLATVLVQSSSTSTSIVVTMVASGLLTVRPAIPIIMGANIGTSVTNTIVSLAQSSERNEFRRAFGGATVHDMFNWLSVLVLLPIECASGYLYHLTGAIVNSFEWTTYTGGKKDLLKTITKPFTKLIIQLDKKVITRIAIGDETAHNESLVKKWCEFAKETQEVNVTMETNSSIVQPDGTIVYEMINETLLVNVTTSVPVTPCRFLFHDLGLNDKMLGLILLTLSLFILCSCLILTVKILNSVFRGKMAHIIKTTINKDLPGCLSPLTGYIFILLGAGLTILVQSSSIFTSTLTPLVGVGVIKLDRVYPLTLGSNIGTTTTGLLAAMAASGEKLPLALQIALCHLFFNITGILVFYPIPAMRLPIPMAKIMGDTTAKYCWFALFYLVMMFFVLPGFVFGLSMLGLWTFGVVMSIIVCLVISVVVINVLQRKCCHRLPCCLQTWDFLPLWMRSLEPLDRILTKVARIFNCCCQRRKTQELAEEVAEVIVVSEPRTLPVEHSTANSQLNPKGWKLSGARANDSGYCTRIPTANNSPTPSRKLTSSASSEHSSNTSL